MHGKNEKCVDQGRMTRCCEDCDEKSGFCMTWQFLHMLNKYQVVLKDATMLFVICANNELINWIIVIW